MELKISSVHKIAVCFFLLLTSLPGFSEGNKYLLSENQLISAPKLFLLDTAPSPNAMRDSKKQPHQTIEYSVAMDETAESILRAKIKYMYDAGSQNIGEVVKFNEQDNLQLPVDLNFKEGVFLASESIITSIQTKIIGAVIDGEVVNTKPKPTYILHFRMRNADNSDNVLYVGESIFGQLISDDYSVSFYKGCELYHVSAKRVDIKESKKGKINRHDDRIILPEDELREEKKDKK